MKLGRTRQNNWDNTEHRAGVTRNHKKPKQNKHTCTIKTIIGPLYSLIALSIIIAIGYDKLKWKSQNITQLRHYRRQRGEHRQHWVRNLRCVRVRKSSIETTQYFMSRLFKFGETRMRYLGLAVKFVAKIYAMTHSYYSTKATGRTGTFPRSHQSTKDSQGSWLWLYVSFVGWNLQTKPWI